jgi:hypothetical protein
MSQSILARVRQKAAQNSYLAKMASEDAPVEEVKQESVATGEPATAMVEGTAGVPDVTENNNTNDFASIGEHVESAVNAEETTAAETIKNEDNPDVQEILAAKDTVIKTASALYQQACIIRDMPLANLESLFNKTASAVEMSDEALFGMIEKSAAAGNVVAQGYVQFCQGMMAGLTKIANDAEALVAQGVPPEEAEAMAAEALANDLAAVEAAPAEDVPAETAPAEAAPAEAAPATEEEIAEAVGAEAEAAAAKLATEAANTIMEMDPSIPPEEAQALGEQLVAEAIQEELVSEEAPAMEQTASAEDMAEDVAGENFEEALLDAAAELSAAAVPEIMALDPSITEEQAAEIADELVAARVAEVFGGAGAAEMPAEMPEGAEEVVNNEMVAEAAQVVDEVIAATAEEIKAASPEISGEEAIMAAEEAVADAMDTLQEQAAIGATDESGEFIVPDEVAAASVEDMVKTASANPLRDTLTPTFAQLFGIDQSAFIKRVTR